MSRPAICRENARRIGLRPMLLLRDILDGIDVGTQIGSMVVAAGLLADLYEMARAVESAIINGRIDVTEAIVLGTGIDGDAEYLQKMSRLRGFDFRTELARRVFVVLRDAASAGERPTVEMVCDRLRQWAEREGGVYLSLHEVNMLQAERQPPVMALHFMVPAIKAISGDRAVRSAEPCDLGD